MPSLEESPPDVGRPAVVRFGPFAFDPANQLLRRGAAELSLPPRALGVLAALLERPGDLVSRQQLTERVWKDAFVTDTSLAEAVSVLRQALGDEPQSPVYIQTVHRRGYRFLAAVTSEALRPAADRSGQSAARMLVAPSIAGWLLPWTVAVLALALAAVAVWRTLSREDADPAPVRFALSLPAGLAFRPDGNPVALSPDGSRLVLSACDAAGCRLYQRPLEAIDLQPLPGTDRATSPFFSPDGRWIGFFADGKVKKAAVSGGAPIVLADLTEPRGGVWTRDGRIIAGGGFAGGLFQLPDAGGAATALTRPRPEDGELRHDWPALTADGRTLLFVIGTSPDAPGSRLAVATLTPSGTVDGWSTVLTGISGARTLGRDLLIVSRGADLQVVRIEAARRIVSGSPQTLGSAAVSAEGAAQFATSDNGGLVVVTPATRPSTHDLEWWNGGRTDSLPIPLADVRRPALSPDASRVAWSATSAAGEASLWTADIDRGASARATFDAIDESPVWSADGTRLYFARWRSGRFQLSSVPAEGGAIATLTAPPLPSLPRAASDDGGTLGVVTLSPASRADIWLVSTAGAAPRPLVATAFDDCEPAFSPDGSLLAYQSDEAGRWDVYVLSLRDGRRVTVSADGGSRPFWSRDGGALFYHSGDRLLRATFGRDSAIAIGPTVEVFQDAGARAVAQARDGRLLLERTEIPARATAVVSLGWDRVAAAALGPASPPLPR